MSMITDASFWNEVATYRRGWKRSTRYSSVSSALAGSRLGWLSTGMSALDGALPFAAHDLVRLVPAPVDEVLHRLDAELEGQREVLGARLELGGAHSRDKRVELLAVLARLLVVAQPALHGLRHALGRQPHL